MKTSENSQSRFLRYKELYENALCAMSERCDGFQKNIDQYNGSDEIDGSPVRALTVRNITYEIIESEIDYEIPMPKASVACYTDRRDKNARTVERLCSAVRDALPFEEMNDRDERQTYIFGSSVWYVDWESEGGGSVGGIRVHCLSPRDFIPQPGAPAVSDMEYCFLRFITTRDELSRAFGKTAEEIERAECDTEGEGSATVVVCFYIGEGGRIGKLVFSGDLLLSDIPDYYGRKAMQGGRLITLERETFNPEDLPEKTSRRAVVPYYAPRTFPIVIRKNSSAMDSPFGTSDCDRIRPQQQAINKVESRILEKLLRSAVTPIMPEDARVTMNNSVFGQVIKMRPGEKAENYGKIDTTPDITQDVKESDRLYEQARRVMGISDALQGNDTEKTESGYARQLKIAQASGRLEGKKRLKYLAYSELYRLIFQHFLAFSDGVRRLSYKDSYGRVITESFNRYDFLEIGETGWEYFDEFLFSVDLNVGSEYKRESLWERNLENLTSGSLGDKTSPETLLRYWQSQARAGYPYARENVEYFKGIAEQKNNHESEKTNEE